MPQGPPRKNIEDRQRRNKHPTLGPPAVPEGKPPIPPTGLRPSLIADWLEYWRSPMAGLVVRSDLGALRRLFHLRERSAKAQELFEANEDPAFARLATTIDGEIRQLEDRFGLSPAARLRFVSELDEAQRAEASMRERAEAEEEAARADPRLADAVTVAADARPSRRAVDGAEPRPRRRRSGG